VAYGRTHEEGVTASIFAVALLVLLGMVALGIDGSRIYDERRQAQNAADHAAIAAAFAACDGSVVADAIAAGEASAGRNGYDDVPTNEVTIAHDGLTPDVHRYTALIDTTIGTTFAQVIGFANLSTNAFARAEATGCDSSGASQAAIWAGGNNCAPGSLRNIEISGNDHLVNGLTYTNGSFYNGGSSSDFLNPPNPSVQYVSSFTGGSNTYTAAQQQVPLPALADRWPGGFDPITDMTTAMWDAYRDSPDRRNTAGGNNQSSLSITTNGIYYTENSSGIDIVNIPTGAHFTVASKNGPIRMPNSYTGRTFWAYENNPAGTPDNLIALSGYAGGGQPCDQFAFERSGEGGTWNGLFWTPRAMSRWSGNLSTINGGFISWAFQMNGNEHTINGGTGQPAAEPDVLLID
jgi:hypothetical protein